MTSTKNLHLFRTPLRRVLVATATATLFGVVGATAVVANSSGPAGPPEQPRPFAVFAEHVPQPGWTLSEGVHPTGASVSWFHKMDPAMDWFAEYYGPAADPNDQPYVSVTGRTAALAPAPGAVRGEINGRAATWSGDSADLGDDTAVTIAWGRGYTLSLSSHGLSLDELRRVAGELRPATEAEWVAEGGVSGDCPPMSDTCG